jgi:hypothetical protein
MVSHTNLNTLIPRLLIIMVFYSYGLNLHSEILQGGFIEQTPYIQYAHMEVLLPADQQSEELVFLYK